MNPKVCLITATKNRHRHIERSVRFFLEQDYPNVVQLIYNNSCDFQRLNNNIPAGKIILVNNCIDYQTKEHYTNLGAIYRDAITHIPEDVEIVSFFDDDDIFLPDHVSRGVEGYLKAIEMGKLAYKPKMSYYRLHHQVTPAENTLEPSIFVNKDHLLSHGFFEETTAQHHKWLNPLVYEDKIFVDPNGKGTLVYFWGDDIPTFKTSGDPNNPQNFKNYENFSKDKGDGIITPLTLYQVKKYYLIS